MPSPTKPHPKHRFDRARLKAAGKAVDRAATEAFRSITIDHTRNFTALLDPPRPGFLGGLYHQFKRSLLSICVTVVRSVLLVVLYALWIPCLLWAIRWFLMN